MAKAFSLGFALLLILQSPQGGQKSTHSSRLGDLQITLTAARIASIQDIQDYKLRPRAGYDVELVFLRVGNVARYPSCWLLQSVWLHVKQGYEYPSAGLGNSPKTDNVLPAEESSGRFAFEIKTGTNPIAIKLVRNAAGDLACASRQNRDSIPPIPLSGLESVSLSLEGLPTRAN